MRLSCQLLGKGGDLVEQGLRLASGVLLHLLQEMVDGLARVGRDISLGRLDARHLEGEEKLGHLDSEAAVDGPQAGLGGQVDVEVILEPREVVFGERLRGGEGGQCEGQRRLGRRGKVDGGEAHAARRNVGYAVDGGLGGVARHRPLDRHHAVLHLGG